MVVCALVPYLALSGALGPITPLIAGRLHMSLQTMSLGSGIANAAYAVGHRAGSSVRAVAAAATDDGPLRGAAVIGSVLAAGAQDAPMFIVGHVLQGLCTSLLLIAAAPPLFLGFPRDKLRPTAMIMNMCIFGAVALGPLIGGVQAGAHGLAPAVLDRRRRRRRSR